MLNKKQYLLVCLVEELAEVQKEALKCLRFGINHSPDYTKTNFDRLTDEWSDLMGIVEMLAEESIFIEKDRSKIEDKKIRVNFYMKHSRNFGILEQ